MNAREAKLQTKATLDARSRTAMAKAQAEKEAFARQVTAAMKNDYPAFFQEILGDIKKATKKGDSSVDFSYNKGVQSRMADKAVDELRARGFSVTDRYSSGYENYGDFNAPCNVWEEHRWLAIGW